MRKKTHSEVEAIFGSEGYRLLSQYEGATAKMDAICPQGHRVKMTWHGFKQGKRCPECALSIRANKRRTDPEYVKQAFEAEGYTLLEQYHRNNVRMDCICSNGHPIKMDWASFQEGVRCLQCSAIGRGATRKCNTAIKAKAAFASEGYTLLDEYQSAHALLRFICPQGHRHQISWTSFSQGHRCALCSGYGPVDPDAVKASFAAEGYTLLDRYQNSKRRMRFLCPQGHKWSVTWGNWQTGTRCAVCSGRIVTRKHVRDAFSAAGYTLLNQYPGDSAVKMFYTCPEGHHHKMNWAAFRDGDRCPTCSKRYVDPELVRETFCAAGYTPLESYQDSKTPIKYRCPNGHEYAMTWGSFRNGTRCPECQGKILHHADIALAFAAEGYELLDQYKNSSTHMRYICPEGHQHSIIWDAFKQGVRCPYCAGMKPTDEERLMAQLSHDIARHIHVYLRRQDTKTPFPSTTSFAAGVAKKILQELGDRPDGYHLDHIIPNSFFDFRRKEEIKACWHIVNLRYIPATENISRGNRLTVEEVERFTPQQMRLLAKASRRPRELDAILFEQGYIKNLRISPSEIQLTLEIQSSG